MLKSLVNVEFKNIESASSSNPTSSGYMTLLNGIAEGDDINQRNGRSILIKSAYVKHTMKCATSGDTAYIRCILFWDKQPSGTAPTGSDLLDTVGGFDLVRAFRNLSNRKRFKIISDKTYTVVNGGPNYIRYTDKYIKMNTHTIYSSTGNTISSISSNALYCFIVSDQPTVTPAVYMAYQLRYIDN